jgi:DNA-binding response OmpR family regulator
MNVLIIEDEFALSKELDVFLKKEGYICDLAYTGKEASEKIFVNNYDFILLDLGLPDYDGLALLKEIFKDRMDASVIILTARGTVDDKVKGLDMGADDYLAKPFSLLELQSRMQAIIRRKHGLKKNIITINGFKIDIDNRVVSWTDQILNLTKKEFDLLHYLVLHKNRVLTRLQLTEHIWGNLMEDDFDSNYIDVHIKNLRKKLSTYEEADWIETVRGLGYRVNI